MIRLSITISVIFLFSCRKDSGIISDLPILETTQNGEAYAPNLQTGYNYEDVLFPDHFLNDNVLDPISTENAVTNEGATLGRVLFYDKNLSINNTISCASCHHQSLGFSDSLPFSIGFEGGLTSRNSMAISNVDYNHGFFWDVRASTIEQQSLMPIQHPVEMGMTLAKLQYKLKLISYYPQLFLNAFGSTEITTQKISLAFGQFLRSMRSYRSKYDVGVEIGFSNFTAQELLGYQIYSGEPSRCSNCHTTQNFGGLENRNNGIDGIYSDLGLAGITNNDYDIGKFKSVSLRNIELTAPYMHDSRFQTLEEVLEFYSSQINAHANLDDLLSTNFTTGGPPIDLNFTKSEQKAIIAFLKTLTDFEFITDPMYSNPFPE